MIMVRIKYSSYTWLSSYSMPEAFYMPYHFESEEQLYVGGCIIILISANKETGICKIVKFVKLPCPGRRASKVREI